MNVLLTARWPAGGIRTYFRYVYGRDDFSDIRLTLVAPDFDLSEFLANKLPEGRIRFIPCDNTNQALFRAAREQLRQERWDLIHSHGFSAGILTEWARLGYRNIPHLMTAHDVFLESQFAGWKGRLKKLMSGISFARMDAIHTVTEDAGRNFSEFFPRIPQDRIVPILHGVDTGYFASGTPWDVRSKLGNVLPSNPVVGFFGRFMAQKGFRVLVRAVELMNRERPEDQKVHVLTWGWGGFVREDYAWIHEQGLERYFHQMPHTDDMPSAIASMDAVAMPSRWEACGLLAMEVLAAGVPIVGTNCIGLREVLDGTPATQVPVGDADALAAALDQALTPEAKARFRDWQAEAVRRFDVTRPARELAELYRRMTGRSPA
ncbi:glycosyltransferase family 4 protein [Hahella sp. SMD15-11]|uniref:Glycosyltransferase family 4 protein n=1 Tax=Thermohahella caldifontis TaxID=3142973 RepID=A0AB39UXF4_9GAMM